MPPSGMVNRMEQLQGDSMKATTPFTPKGDVAAKSTRQPYPYKYNPVF